MYINNYYFMANIIKLGFNNNHYYLIKLIYNNTPIVYTFFVTWFNLNLVY